MIEEKIKEVVSEAKQNNNNKTKPNKKAQNKLESTAPDPVCSSYADSSVELYPIWVVSYNKLPSKNEDS